MMGFGDFFSKNIWTYDASIYIQYDFLEYDFRDATQTNYNSVDNSTISTKFSTIIVYSYAMAYTTCNLYF